MAHITFIEPDGAQHDVNALAGMSVMDCAKRYAIAGIDGDCGGACACGTCHVYIEKDGFDRLPPMDELEREMLDFAFDVQPNSRLSCQIKINESLDGLVVRVPQRQY